MRVPLLVWAALLVMVLGVHRLVVSCSGPHDGAAIELAHERHGCAHDHAHAHGIAHAHPHEGDESPCPDGEPCTDSDVELLTFRGDPGVECVVDEGVAIAPPTTAPSAPDRAAPRRARAIAPEPPWPDRRMRERRAVVLLI